MQMRYKKAGNTPQGNLQLPQALGNAAAGIDQKILFTGFDERCGTETMNEWWVNPHPAL